MRLFIFDIEPSKTALFFTDKSWIWPDIVQNNPGLAHVDIQTVRELDVDVRESDVKIDTVYIPINVNQIPKAY